jgi:hypothetical protein
MIGAGLVKSINNQADSVQAATENVGQSALDGLSSSLAALEAMVNENVDLTPTITPVLDLSLVNKTSADIWRMLNQKPLTLDTSISSATSADSSVQASQAANDDSNKPGDTFNFTQNNTSPKALSTADIYRNTKNQLSTAKGVLTA